MKPTLLCVWVLAVGCATTGYVEPGPMSPSANPPGPASVQSGSVLQPSTATGTPGEGPPTVNMLGGQVTEAPRRGSATTSPNTCQHDRDCERRGDVCLSGLCTPRDH